MRKIIVLISIITLFALALAYAQTSVAKQATTQIVLTEKLSYKLVNKLIIDTFKKNQVYLVTHNKDGEQTYYYGCDGYGSKKAYVTLTQKDKLLNVNLYVTVEGDLSQEEAEGAAVKLLNEFTSALENKEKALK